MSCDWGTLEIYNVICKISAGSRNVRIDKNIAHCTAMCLSPYNSFKLNFHINTQLGYEHAFCKNVVSIKICFNLCCRKNTTCLIAGLLRIGQTFYWLL
jgi:hypothetical protein